MHEVKNKFLKKFRRFFLLKMLAARAQYLLFGPQKNSKINDGCVAEIKMDWKKI